MVNIKRSCVLPALLVLLSCGGGGKKSSSADSSAESSESGVESSVEEGPDLDSGDSGDDGTPDSVRLDTPVDLDDSRDEVRDGVDDQTDEGDLDALTTDVADSPDEDVSDPCYLGVPCTSGRGCRIGVCLEEYASTIGGDSDPITSSEGRGPHSVETTVWSDGYCTMSLPTAEEPDACTGDQSCGPCGKCVQGDATSICLRACQPSLIGNECRDGYKCSLFGGFCAPGCTSDDECRIAREDTNQNGVIDRYDPNTNPDGDHLVYDDESDAYCDDSDHGGTFRCLHSGRVGVQAGDPCRRSSECEANGVCLTEPAGWSDGYCTKFGCDLEGNTCADGGSCFFRGAGIIDLDAHMCVEPCVVGTFAEGVSAEDPPSWFSRAARGGCRSEYACFWDGTRSGHGGCVPGVYNEVRSPNFGRTCRADGAPQNYCYSPFGLGFCSALGDEGYCTLLDCGAPGIPEEVCGSGAQCLDVDGTEGDATACVQSCDSAEDCGQPASHPRGAPAPDEDPTMGCLDWDGQESTPRVCWPACLTDDDCREGYSCAIPPGGSVGGCELQ